MGEEKDRGREKTEREGSEPGRKIKREWEREKELGIGKERE